MHRQRQRVGAVAEVEVDALAVGVEVDAAVDVNGVTGDAPGPGWKAAMKTELAGRGSPAVRLGIEDAERLELAADIGLALRVAVGSGGRVGPTGRPMITMPPLSEEGYWLRNSAHSRDTLYCSSRARGQSPATQASNRSRHRLGQMEPAAE